ncbi:MAG TPA: phage tail protein [Silvibacterium sp.]|nr:phage tail protein [Silvibacterium sp.]
MPSSSGPYASYAFVLFVIWPDGNETPLGGFTEAAGIPQKITGIQKVGDVTLKRGVVNSGGLWNWISAARSHGSGGHRDAVLTRNASGDEVMTSWKLHNARPLRYDGPTLGFSSESFAVEELVLAAETIGIIAES